MATEGLSISGGAMVCDDATLTGDIRVGSGTVVHPRCTISCVEGGSIVIGPDCVIEEQVAIVNRQPVTMEIGAMNLFEVGCRVEALRVGSRNVLEPKSQLGAGTSVGDGCVIGATVCVDGDTQVPNDTVVYSVDGALHQRLQPRSSVRRGARRACAAGVL